MAAQQTRGPMRAEESVAPDRLAAGVLGSAGRIEVVEPATGDVLGVVPRSSADDVERAYARARAGQRGWAARSPRQRAAVAGRLADLMLHRRDVGLDLLQRETGKTRAHAFEELVEAVLSSQYYARHTARLLRPERRQGTFPLLTQAVELHHPRGVIGLISPWNYPLALSMDVLPALMAGNAVVHKADSTTPFSALWIRSLMIEAGLPAEVWQVVVGDPDEIGDPLIDHADYVAFTGSTEAGRRIAARCGERLIGCSLELGGKNPMLVLSDADLELAATAAVRACFGSAGQLCVGIERILVEEPVYTAFVSRFVERVRGLRLGAPLGFGADVGSLASARQLDRITALVDRARAEGATVLAGGEPRPDAGPWFYAPTVLADVPADSTVEREETFGPVVTVRPVPDVEAGIAAANDTVYGLNAAVFGRDVSRARAVAARIEAGTVSINEGYAAAYGSQGAPMGGRKASGLGRRHGPSGLLRFTEPQTVASQHLVGFDAPPALGERRYVDLVSRALLLTRRLHVR
ncbi:succinate-semialdehyde dehydrogenase/glutarate-semialdehyde dehydrogenase [Friedmanniella endophytica]|uniref:Succinate-semialdehyde dehydrogenase/glutarate-semialdehyde dehydrogenase n=1 Tax=Microlunatus kandeliicorticis TaxID=1759536 RepID=A0A7W3ISI3_9ACTN|nr:succinic semialdehyde dehydrogenase [Microlunatus kandeliicorticis]MBA8794432.1 succinate-semialdehyde dehydrogenase/glutarate-semialdehyde dehydrogenase [Microlunatus kandeliicorticis]